jgi:poly(3-hydroxyalkanoate) depolymerase
MSARATVPLWNLPTMAKTEARPDTRRPVDRLSDVQVDPATGVHIGTLCVGEQRLRVGIRPAPAGCTEAPLLVCNGIGANLELAVPMMARLDRIETVIFDVPGAGKSPPPKRPYRLFELARLTRRVLDQLGYAQIDLMGVSWGGGLAQQFAIQYPARVRRLVLAATAMGGMTMLPGNPRTLLKMVNPRRYVDKGYMKRVAPTLYGGALRDDPSAIKLFTDHARGGDPRGYRYQLLAMFGWTSLPWLWRIRHPTLVLAGNDDPLVPLVNARLMTKLLRNARLQVFDDGHLFLLTRAAETAQAIDGFLREG